MSRRSCDHLSTCQTAVRFAITAMRRTLSSCRILDWGRGEGELGERGERHRPRRRVERWQPQRLRRAVGVAQPHHHSKRRPFSITCETVWPLEKLSSTSVICAGVIAEQLGPRHSRLRCALAARTSAAPPADRPVPGYRRTGRACASPACAKSAGPGQKIFRTISPRTPWSSDCMRSIRNWVTFRSPEKIDMPPADIGHHLVQAAPVVESDLQRPSRCRCTGSMSESPRSARCGATCRTTSGTCVRICSARWPIR